MKKILIISVISLFVILISALGFYFTQAKKYKQLTKEKETILATKERIFKNSIGQYANEVNVWSIKYKDLEKAHEKDIKGIASDYEVKLSKAYENAELYKRKNKDLISYYSAQLQAKDTIYQPMPADCILEPISTKFIDIGFIYKDSSVGITYDYHTGISTLVTLYPKRKENGNKHWPNWGIIWGWDKKSITTVEDDKAKLTNQVSIEFKR